MSDFDVVMRERVRRFDYLLATEPRGEAFESKLRGVLIDSEREHIERVAELATLRQKLAEAEKERDDALKYGRSVVSDFPWDAKHPLPLREVVYALESSIQGITLAHGDREKERDEARASLATAEAELKKCGEAVMTYVETVKRKNREIWAAEADCAAMREALLGIGEYWNGAEGSAVDACEEARARVDAALTRPTGQAILDRLKLAEDVADSCGDHVDCVDQYYSREALAAYRAARKANT